MAARPAVLPAWFYLAPIALIGAAIAVFMLKADTDEHVIILVSGISLVFFGLFSVIEGSMVPHLRNKALEPHIVARKEAKTTSATPLDDTQKDESEKNAQ